MTLLWLLTASALANIAIWSGQKFAPSMAYLLVTLGLTLGWQVHEPAGYFALANGTEYHDSECYAVKTAILDGDRLVPLSESDARHAGLSPHRCLKDNLAYTVSTPAK